MRVELSVQALDDLLTIARWIARDNPDRAQSFAAELRLKCLAIGRMPRRFPIIHKVAGRDVHKRAYRGYLIFYVILDAHVRIVRIVHGSRDWVALFAEPE